MRSLLQKNPLVQHWLYKNTKSRAFFKLYGIVIQELRVCFGQFFSIRYPVSSLLRCLRYSFQSLLRLLLGRSISLSYSYTAEDRLIESLLKPIITRPGFYVDVGCNEPEFISNSFLFYRRGWRGVCIDANENLIRKHQRIRPKDKAICALIANQNTTIDFYHAENPVLSSADPAAVGQFTDEGIRLLTKQTLQSQTLTQLFDACQVPEVFDFLSIDIEGNDIQALYSLDLSRYRPRLIVFEWEDFSPEHVTQEDIWQYLYSHQYKYVGYLLTNVYFLVVESEPTLAKNK